MREEYTEMKEVKHFRIACDICGKTQVDSYNGFGSCSICKKLVCWKCGEFFYESGGDYPSHVACPDHKEQIIKIYDEYNDLMDSVPDVDEMIKLAINKE